MHGNSTTVNDGVKKCNNYNEGEEAMLILIDVEENFNSNLTADPFRWIPKGLMEDLMDNKYTYRNFSSNRYCKWIYNISVV